MAALDVDEEYQDTINKVNQETQRVELAPTTSQKIGRFTVVCLILNRTIGSGIFVTPSNILRGTGSVGASLLLWAFGGLVATCGLLVWLELGLSVPLKRVSNDEPEKNVPRSGGEKNYFEFIFRKPAFLATCMYGTVFVLLGNLSGNAIAFGQYVYEASGFEPSPDQPNAPRGPVIAVAIALLTGCILIHFFSRRGGIMINNLFAIFKIALLLAIAVLGFIKAGGSRLGGGEPSATENFKPSQSFKSDRRDVVSYTDSLLYVLYTFSGFEQPFYVLSEVRRPRRTFPTYTLLAMAIAIVLFMLVNVAYLCAVPKEVQLEDIETRMATIFLGRVFGNESAQRAMAGLIAFSIAGNIFVMTFTAARVKQEIAKEGILPFSLFFATSYTSPWAWLRSRFSSLKVRHQVSDHLEQTPIPALGLHWLTSIFLLAITSMLQPPESYNFLVSLYSYVIIVGFGFAVSLGLLLLTFSRTRAWTSHVAFSPPLRPLHTIIYCLASGFVLYAAFAPPNSASPYSERSSGLPWWLIPAIGQSAWFWGIVWYAGLRGVMWLRREVLVVTRVPVVAMEEGEWVMKFEVVTHEWHAFVRGRGGSEEGEGANGTTGPLQMSMGDGGWDDRYA